MINSKALSAAQKVILCCAALVSFAPAACATPSTTQETQLLTIQKLFEYFTKSLPRQMWLSAEVETIEPAWTDAQVQQEIKKQEELEARLGAPKSLSSTNRDSVKRVREAHIRAAHTGVKRLLLQERFLGNELWRLDQTDLSINKLRPQFRNGETYLETFENISSTNVLFRNVHSMFVNHEISSAILDQRPKVQFRRRDLWQAFVIEPQAALRFISLTLKKGVEPPVSALSTSYAGLSFDPKKASELLEGSNSLWALTVAQSFTNGEAMEVICLSGKIGTVANGTRFLYWLNSSTLSRLPVVRIIDNETHFQYMSLRTHYDTNDFPWMWTTKVLDRQGKVLNEANYRFLKVNMNCSSLGIDTFVPHFPTNYIVSEFDVHGRASVIQNPLNAPILKLSPASFRTSGLPKVFQFTALIVVLVLPPLCVFALRRRQVNK